LHEPRDADRSNAGASLIPHEWPMLPQVSGLVGPDTSGAEGAPLAQAAPREAALADDLALRHLQAIEPGWPPHRLDEHVSAFMDRLARHDGLTETKFKEYVGRLRKTLKAEVYPPLADAKYGNLFKTATKVLDAQRRAAKVADAGDASEPAAR